MLDSLGLQRGGHQNSLRGFQNFGWALRVDLEAAWALARGMQPAVTCTRARGSTDRIRDNFVVGCPLAVQRFPLVAWISAGG